MTNPRIGCLILACGNTLREDHGIGPWLAEWAAVRFEGDTRVHVICRQQWTPELAEDLSRAATALFVDCSATAEAGSVEVVPVEASLPSFSPGTHQLDAPQLLALAQELYDRVPERSLLLTVGAGSMELREGFSEAVAAAQPRACRVLEDTILQLLGERS